MSQVHSPSSSSATTNTTVGATLSKQQRLQRIADIFKMQFRTLDPGIRRERVFDRVVQACCKGEWGDLEQARPYFKGLKNNDGQSVLNAVVERKGRAVVENIFRHNLFAVLARRERYEEALHAAADVGRVDTMQVLLSNIGIDEINRAGKTALHVAIEADQPEVVKFLLQAHANLKSTCQVAGLKQELSALALAVHEGRIECIDVLLTKTTLANNEHNVSGIGNPLHLAIQFGQQEVLEHFLNNYFEQSKGLLKSPNANGLVPMSMAAREGAVEALAFLEKKGANLDATDRNGWTPMHYAVSARQRQSIEMLIHLGAKINFGAFDSRQTRPIDLLPTDSKEGEVRGLRALLSNPVRRVLRAPNPAEVEYKGLVFQGGGPKGIAYVGCLRVLEEQNKMKNVRRAAGTSAGAITAALAAVNYHSSELEELLKSTPIDQWLDHPLSKKRIRNLIANQSKFNVLWKVFNVLCRPQKIAAAVNPFHIVELLWKSTGVCKGDVFEEWMEARIQQKTGIQRCTFGELRRAIELGKPFKHLHVFSIKVGTKQEDHEIARFDSESGEWDDLVISRAVRCSMSIPGVFIPATLLFKDLQRNVVYARKELGSYCDGGMLYNLPIEVWDFRRFITSGVSKEEGEYPIHNSTTLGFSLYTPGETQALSSKQIKTVGQLIRGLFSVYNQAERLIRQLNAYNKRRIVHVSNQGVGLLEFKVSSAKQAALIEGGYNATRAFFHLGPREVPAASSSPTSSNTPSYYCKTVGSNMVDRNTLRTQLYLRFLRDVRPSSDTVVSIVRGKPGVGKTDFVCDVAHRNREKFHFIQWIDCSTPESADRGWRELAHTVGCSVRGSPSVLERGVIQRLESEEFQKPWLLILDHVREKPRYPSRNGVVLVVTRSETLQFADSLKVPSFTEKEALDCFRKWGVKGDRASQLRLAEVLQFNPLTLRLAVVYLKRERTSIADYLEMLSCVDRKGKGVSGKGNVTFSNRLDTVLQHTLSAVADKRQEAADLLELCSWLHHERIPVSWATARLPTGESARPIITLLSSYGLIHHDEDRQQFDMTPSLQVAVRALRSDRAFLSQAFALLGRIGQHFKPSQPATWQHGQQWLAHACLFLQHEGVEDLKPEEHGNMYAKIGDMKTVLGDLKGARTAYERAAQFFDKNLHRQAEILDKLAENAKALKQWSFARGFYEKRLQLLRTLRTQTSRNVGDALNSEVSTLRSLGNTLVRLNNHRQAVEVYDQALTVLHTLHGRAAKHPQIAAVHYSKAEALRLCEGGGRQEWDLARRSFQTALTIYRENHGKDQPHEDTARALGGLARVSARLGEKDRAGGYYQCCLKMLLQLNPNSKAVARLKLEIQRHNQRSGGCLVS